MVDKSGKNRFPQRKKHKPTGLGEKVINIIKILNMIETGNCPSVRELAEACEVSERSIYRYLYTLNQVVPVVYDSSEGGYRLENPNVLKAISATIEELSLLLALYDFLKRSSPKLAETFMSLIDKFHIVGNVKDEVFVFTPLNPPAATDGEKFEQISKAVLNSEQIKINYSSISTGDLTERIIDPYGLIFHDGLWYVYAFCHLRQDFRTFALDRIVDITEIQTKFKKLEGFSLRERLRQSWALWEGNSIRVRVRFSRDVADHIKRKPKWHISEEIVENKDGTIELMLTVSHLDELKWWLYSWIPHIESIEPEILREEIVRELKEEIDKLQRARNLVETNS